MRSDTVVFPASMWAAIPKLRVWVRGVISPLLMSGVVAVAGGAVWVVIGAALVRKSKRFLSSFLWPPRHTGGEAFLSLDPGLICPKLLWLPRYAPMGRAPQDKQGLWAGQGKGEANFTRGG